MVCDVAELRSLSPCVNVVEMRRRKTVEVPRVKFFDTTRAVHDCSAQEVVEVPHTHSSLSNFTDNR